MINYEEIYRQVLNVTVRGSPTYDSEVAVLVAAERKRIGLRNPDLGAELNLDMARRNISASLGLTLAGKEEFEERERGLDYELYHGLANKLLPQESHGTREPVLV